MTIGNYDFCVVFSKQPPKEPAEANPTCATNKKKALAGYEAGITGAMSTKVVCFRLPCVQGAYD